MRPRQVAVTLLAILLLASLPPQALAHGGEDHGGPSDGTDVEAGEAPHPHGYDPFAGEEFWGDVHRIPHPDSQASDPAVSDGWVVWVADDGGGASSDIHAYNLTREIRIEITDDDARQYDPDVDGTRVAWVEADDGHGRVRLFDLETGESRVLSSSKGLKSHTTIDGQYVAWQDRRSRHQAGSSDGSVDIYAFDLEEDREVPVATGPERDVQPVLDGTHVGWLQREYTQWDVRVHDLSTNRTWRATADINREINLRAADEGFVYFQRHRDGHGYHGYHFYPASDRTVDLGFDASSPRVAAPSEGHVLDLQRFVDNETMVLLHPPTSETKDLHTGRLDFKGSLAAENGTVAFIVETRQGPQLVAFEYHDLATEPAPEVVIESPTEGEIVHNRTTVVGHIEASEAWPEPRRMYATLDQAARWIPASGDDEWTIDVDFSDVPLGRHTLRVAAEYPEGPPQFSSVRVSVGQPLDFTRDFSPHLQGEERSLSSAILNTIPLLIVLLLFAAAVVLLAARTYLRWLRKRHPEVRYVPPDEPPGGEASSEGDSPGDGETDGG